MEENDSKENILERIRNDAKFVSENAQFVKIREDVIEDLVLNFFTEEELNKWSLPAEEETEGFLYFLSPRFNALSFANEIPFEIRQKMNYFAVVDLINFASGFRNELTKEVGKGAYQTIKGGVNNMHHKDPFFLSSSGLSQLTLSQVKEFFGLEKSKDVAIDRLSKIIRSALAETGEVLLSLNFADFADFYFFHTSPDQGKRRAEKLVKELKENFPVFADIHKYKGREINILKKAQLITADLHRQFGELYPDRFNFEDIDDLTVMSDNVLPAVLRKLGILQITSGEYRDHLDAALVLPPGDFEIELRCCAIYSSYLIVQSMRKLSDGPFKDYNEMKLDYYLWCKGKDPSFRSFHRHYTQQTLYY